MTEPGTCEGCRWIQPHCNGRICEICPLLSDPEDNNPCSYESSINWCARGTELFLVGWLADDDDIRNRCCHYERVPAPIETDTSQHQQPPEPDQKLADYHRFAGHAAWRVLRTLDPTPEQLASVCELCWRGCSNVGNATVKHIRAYVEAHGLKLRKRCDGYHDCLAKLGHRRASPP